MCSEHKPGCTFSAESDQTEAAPPNKRRATSKKAKGKEAAEPVASGSGSESGLGDVLERLLVEIQGMRGEFRTGLQGVRMELGELRRTGRGMANDVRDLTDYILGEGQAEEEVEKEKSETEIEDAEETMH